MPSCAKTRETNRLMYERHMNHFFSVLVGCIAAGVAVSFVEKLGHALYAPPVGLSDKDSTPEERRDIISNYLKSAPFGALLFPCIAWNVGCLAGGFIAAWTTTDDPMSAGVWTGGIMLAVTAIQLIAFPHPAWMWIAVVTLLPATFFGVELSEQLPLGSPTVNSATDSNDSTEADDKSR